MTWSEHKDVRIDLFKRLYDARLTARPSKSFTGYRNLKCLGHFKRDDGLQPNPDKVKAIDNAEGPMTLRQVKSFLGLVRFFTGSHSKVFCNCGIDD